MRILALFGGLHPEAAALSDNILRGVESAGEAL